MLAFLSFSETLNEVSVSSEMTTTLNDAEKLKMVADKPAILRTFTIDETSMKFQIPLHAKFAFSGDDDRGTKFLIHI